MSIARAGLRSLPEPPSHLTETQAGIWCAVVATKPPDWFQADSFPVLSDYCRAVALDNEIAVVLNEFDRTLLADGKGLESWKELIRLQSEQQKLVAMLATKLRLTPQSRYNPLKANTENNRAGLARPWSRVLEHGAN